MARMYRFRSTILRTAMSLTAAGLVAAYVVPTHVASAAAEDGAALLNGKDLAGWKPRDEKGNGAWKAAADAKVNDADPKTLSAVGEPKDGQSAIVLEKPVHGADLISEQSFGDCELHVELMVPKGSNSGVYLMGQYEVQVLDSFGKKDADLKPGDLGGIYNTKAPTTNAAKAPGEWQTLDVHFKAPRFDKDGKKIENATFVLVKLNGTTIHTDVDAPKPTGSELPGGEKPTGPILLQGDHGSVAFRNIKVKPIAFR